MYRHGDLLFREIAEVPEGAQSVPISCNPMSQQHEYVAAEGEVTGHAHRLIASSISVWDVAGQRYVTIPEGGVLTHEEHAKIELPPGTYEIIRQREWDLSSEIRQVTD